LAETTPSVNLTVCHIREIKYNLPVAPCDRCQESSPSFTTAERVTIDLNLEYPILLHVTVSVHHCTACAHYFRAQPPFLQRGAIYTNRVMEKGVQSVYEDGMAMRRVPVRLARDFWVQPSEGSIRRWCRAYAAAFDFATDYQPWVVSEFSGILCVDEVYQDRLALLLAVDPAAPDGDRLVGYQLVHGDVDADDVERFLTHLKGVGIEPDEVVTDGSALYPTVLAKVWSKAAHQLCLFHETRHVTKATMKAINAIRKNLPQPPPTSGTRGGGPLHDQPPSDDPNDPTTQRWYWRQARRRAQITQVHELAQQGLSQRAIARQTGHHRQTVKQWLAQPVPPLPEDMPTELSELAALPAPRQRQVQKQQLKRQVHQLAQEGLSHAAIARRVGIHRVTVKSWLDQEPPPAEAEEPANAEQDIKLPPPPAPWSSWDQVRQVREALQEHRFLLLRRPENLNSDEQTHVATLLACPVGAELQVLRSFLEDWYRLWKDEKGQRRALDEARVRYDAWRTDEAYRAVAPLRRLQQKMTDAKFEKLSQFLRHPEWEATNNGAERGGRAFRHRQAPHFNLRKEASIEQSIVVSACLRKQMALRPPVQPLHTCQRGRKRRASSNQSAWAMAT
jgi:transposase